MPGAATQLSELIQRRSGVYNDDGREVEVAVSYPERVVAGSRKSIPDAVGHRVPGA